MENPSRGENGILTASGGELRRRLRLLRPPPSGGDHRLEGVVGVDSLEILSSLRAWRW